MQDNSIRHFNTLADLYQALGLTIRQDAEFTIHSLPELHRNRAGRSPLFRANYYSFALILSGSGRYTLDGSSYDTNANTIYFTNPGHVKGFEIIEPYEGYLITMSEAFLKQHVHEAVLDEFPFLLAETVAPNYLEADDFREYYQLAEQMYREYHSSSAYRYRVLSNLMVIFLFKIKEHLWHSYDPLQEGDRSSQIVRSFQTFLERHFRDLLNGKRRELPQVQDLARALNLHPNYLSTVIKRKTGKSVNTWIGEKATAEARALLSKPGMSIKAAAYQLAFKDPAHFSRYFKKHTGQTPSAFRQQLRR